jgi:signal transduction histidine kinase
MTELKPAAGFVQLLAAELQNLKRTAATFELHAGDVVFRQGDPGNGVYVVEDGVVEISALIQGQQRRVLSQLGPGTFFGEMAVLDEQPRSATVTALVDTTLSFISSEEMRGALAKSPELMFSLVREFSERMRQFDQRFLEEVVQAERLGLVGRFAQTIVHDFKNPLNMIGFAADAAAVEDAPLALRTEAKAIIRTQVDRMSNMISELLEFTRGSGRPRQLEPTSYHTLIHNVIREISAESRGRNVTVECMNEPPDITIAADGTRLMRVFLNLIHNAIEMLPNGGRVALRFSTDGSDVVTEIADTGPGIAPEVANRLFEPFATHGKDQGTGLGLSICRRIIEDHRGSIYARNDPAGGAVFGFRLPM